MAEWIFKAWCGTLCVPHDIFVYTYVCHVCILCWKVPLNNFELLFKKSILNSFLSFPPVSFRSQFYQSDYFLFHSVISWYPWENYCICGILEICRTVCFPQAVEMELEMNSSVLIQWCPPFHMPPGGWSFISRIFEMTTASHCLDCQLTSWNNKTQPMLWHKAKVWFWKSQMVRVSCPHDVTCNNG